MHPIWTLALNKFDVKMILPIGRKVTGRRDALVERAVRQIAGSERSLTVLAFGEYSDQRADVLRKRARERLNDDPDHAKKEEAAKSRYSTVDEAG